MLTTFDNLLYGTATDVSVLLLFIVALGYI